MVYVTIILVHAKAGIFSQSYTVISSLLVWSFFLLRSLLHFLQDLITASNYVTSDCSNRVTAALQCIELASNLKYSSFTTSQKGKFFFLYGTIQHHVTCYGTLLHVSHKFASWQMQVVCHMWLSLTAMCG